MIKPKIVGVVFSALFTLSASADTSSQLFQDWPNTPDPLINPAVAQAKGYSVGQHELSNGAKVNVPFRWWGSRMLIAFGHIKESAAIAHMNRINSGRSVPLNYELSDPLPLPPPIGLSPEDAEGRVMATFAMIRHQNTSCGPIEASYFSFGVKAPCDNMAECTEAEKVQYPSGQVFVVYNMNNYFCELAGEELWGMTKEYANSRIISEIHSFEGGVYQNLLNSKAGVVNEHGSPKVMAELKWNIPTDAPETAVMPMPIPEGLPEEVATQLQGFQQLNPLVSINPPGGVINITNGFNGYYDEYTSKGVPQVLSSRILKTDYSSKFIMGPFKAGVDTLNFKGKLGFIQSEFEFTPQLWHYHIEANGIHGSPFDGGELNPKESAE